MGYQWAKADGEIVEADYNPDSDTLTSDQVRNILYSALTQFNREVKLEPVSTELGEVYNVSFLNGEKRENFVIAVKEMTPGGREALKDEQRIQQKYKHLDFAYQKQQNGEDAVSLGVYQRDEQVIFCGWKLKASTAATTETPISKQIKIRTIAEAMKEGFAQQGKGKGEYACAFRKEFIFFYLHNYKWLHDGVVSSIKDKTRVLPEDNCLPEDLRYKYNRIVFGAPGTGKSYRLEQDRESFGTNYERVTFHPSYSYAQFFGTYKPTPVDSADSDVAITYRYVPGPFMRLLVKALSCPRESFLLLIEEINRANPATVFGDTFQLLDRVDGVSEYPIEVSEDVRAFLKSEIGEDITTIALPSNLYIWATMNSADQGVFPMDTAFKRRWDFEYMDINHNEEEVDCIVALPGGRRVKWNALRHSINNLLISLHVNEDKLIGPFFIGKSILENDTAFKDVFKSKVLMYLFEDAAKQRRSSLFSGCEAHTFFSVCSDYDSKGEGIFGLQFSDETVKTDIE